jgi:hypothetical protein
MQDRLHVQLSWLTKTHSVQDTAIDMLPHVRAEIRATGHRSHV